jgi:uncharacterized membrane protein YdjX (TVP38/TMEM64 family)
MISAEKKAADLTLAEKKDKKVPRTRLDVKHVQEEMTVGLQRMRTNLQKLGKIDLKKQIELSRRTVRVEKNIVIIILVLAILGLLAFFVGNSFESPQDAAMKFRSLGALGPLLVIFLIILEIVFAPLPGTLIAIAAGFAFGTFWGAVWVFIGSVIGGIIAFLIARKFGRPFVEKIVPPEKLEPYDEFFKRRGVLILWIAFAFPIFPSDILSYVAGLSTIDFRKFLTILLIASIPNVVILTYVGSLLAKTGFSHVTLFAGGVLLFTLIVGSIVYLYLRKKMKGEDVRG